MDLKNPDRERPKKFTDNHASWELLAAAIIRSACEDYKTFSGKGRQTIERFFRSVYFSNISKIDPEWLIKNLREMYPVRTGFINGA